jgi:hypothetical protein
MVSAATISAINQILKSYFDKHKGIPPVPAKEMMPQFIAAGIFPADQKKGLPIRKVLRQLDKTKQLHLIPFVLPERKQKNTNWFFTAKAGNAGVSKAVPKKETITAKKPARLTSDETYVIDLCDEILGIKALRQHKFDFLLGDKNSTGLRRKLPVDAFYPSLNLVIEYREIQHTKPVSHFDKPNIKTISGVHRGVQRNLYDQRRREVLPGHGITLIEIPHDLFTCNSRSRIIRNRKHDIIILSRFFKK